MATRPNPRQRTPLDRGTPVGCWDLMELDSIPALQTLVEGFPTPNSPVRTFVEATRGHPAYLYRGSGFFIAFPDDPAHVTPPHQDGWADSSHGDYRRVWIPITRIPFGDGGLAVAPGTHRLGPLPRRDFPELRDRPTPEAPTPTRRIRGVDPAVVDDHWHTTEFGPGDALIFHIDLLHRGLPPTSDRIRLALSVMTSRTTDPHPTPHTNDYTLPELLTRKRTLWHLAQPLGLTHDQLATIHRHLLTHALPVDETNLRKALTTTSHPEDTTRP